jgi:K+-sensing histidine kinase KdpD
VKARRDLLAVVAAIVAPLALMAVLVPFTITRTADLETTVLILVIGLAVTELAVWGRRQHLAASRRVGYLEGINAAAEAVAAGGSPVTLVDQVAGQLTRLLSLRSCRFEYGVAGLGQPARLQHNGQVMAGGQVWERDGWPGDTELLVENHGLLQGRYLMVPEPGARPTLEQRLVVAAAFADQVGAALAASRPVTS